MTDHRPRAVGITPMETRREAVLHVAQRAEQLGYTGFYLAEGWGHDAAVLLAEVAVRTTRLRLGTGVLTVWGRSAAQLAMLAASLDDVSGGRFTLGLGAGSPQLAGGLHEQPFTGAVSRLGTVTRQVRRLLAGERLPSDGTARTLRLSTPPRPQVPIHLAALGPVAVRLAGELADGWYPFLLPRSGLKAGIVTLEKGAAAAGRPRPRVCPGLPVAVAPDPEQSLAQASWWVTHYLVGMGQLYARALRREGLGAEVDAVLAANPSVRTTVVPPAARNLLDELTVWGDAPAARAALHGWYAEGADEPVLVLPPGRPIEELDYSLEALRPS
jgi:alkanesulfonate monooxygenase SsuD/methylene tetrahydromethanopterin reductase-like flavin-dependent oxidoreductase (luciferase family)